MDKYNKLQFILIFSLLLFAKSNVFAQVIDTIQFNNREIKLTGFLIKPITSTDIKHPVVVVLHGASMGLHSYPLYLKLAEDLNAIGYAVFVYDRRGAGLSKGEKNNADYYDLAKDASAAIEKLKMLPSVDSSKIGLYGISQGCWIAAITNTLSSNISFQILVSPSTIAPSPQMDYAATENLRANGFEKSTIDSAIQLRNIIDDFYRGKVSYTYASEKRKEAEKAIWFKDANIFDLDETPETGTWRKDMDFDPLFFFKKCLSPTLVIYGEYDKWVPVMRGINDWRSLNLRQLIIKRVANSGHLMILNEKDDPISPIISLKYRNIIKSWVKMQK